MDWPQWRSNSMLPRRSSDITFGLPTSAGSTPSILTQQILNRNLPSPADEPQLPTSRNHHWRLLRPLYTARRAYKYEDWAPITFDSELQREKELWTKRQTLIGMNEYICPHTRTSSLNLGHNKSILNLTIHLRYHLGDGNEVYSTDEEDFGMCGEPDCHTTFGHGLAPIYHGWRFHPSPSIFQIWQRNGRLRDVKEPKWVAQLE